MTEITIAMEVNFFRLTSADYFVPVAVKIPGSELALARKGGASHSIQYETGFTLLPGKCVLKVLARNAETGRIETYLTNFTIPNLNRETVTLPISSVVLCSQRVPTADAIYYVKQKIASNTANPLISEAGKLIPSVTRVFSRGRELYVYLQAYEFEASTIQPLVVFATFFQGDVKVLQTVPVAVTDGLEARSKAVPLTFNVSLGDLPPGVTTARSPCSIPQPRRSCSGGGRSLSSHKTVMVCGWS